LYGVRELGFYNRAVTTQQMPSSTVSALVGRVALPLLASKEGDATALRQSLRLAMGCTMLLNVPAMVGLILLSDQIVVVLFGSRWLPAVPMLAILAASGILLPLHVINVQLVLARAQSRTFIRNELIKKSMGIACVVIGSLFGVIGLAWGQVVYSVLGMIVNAAPARDLGYGPIAQLRDLTGIFFASAVMAAGVVVLKSQLASGPLVTLTLCSVVGFLLYIVVGWLCGIRLFRESATLVASDLISWQGRKPM
jgi:O-antigen/teichoic acid export membrane protein